MKAHLPPHVADALASAFLATGAWTRRALAARGIATIGDNAKWMGVLVEGVLARFPHPPRERFHSLSRFIASLPLLSTKRQRLRPASVVRSLVADLAMGEPRWDVPRIATTGDLARWLELSPTESEWFADARGLERLDRDE